MHIISKQSNGTDITLDIYRHSVPAQFQKFESGTSLNTTTIAGLPTSRMPVVEANRIILIMDPI